MYESVLCVRMCVCVNNSMLGNVCCVQECGKYVCECVDVCVRVLIMYAQEYGHECVSVHRSMYASVQVCAVGMGRNMYKTVKSVSTQTMRVVDVQL